ncbi:MAG: NADPH-dependent assimilatory sulfite reductase hemoprotein subunit [Alphaproteobacteria bacterium]|nr:NADPH-dependent assimilatory sulfite reductase hemoprotein subunit [Alphaproteobacteria bacterium]
MAKLGKGVTVEQVKHGSHHLRGGIATSLAAADAGFAPGDQALIKFHGLYEGYDRDSATALKQRGEDKAHQFMARVRIPGGRLTAAQYLELDRLADLYGNATLRITTRQAIQFHGVLKIELKELLAGIDSVLLTTLAACGDVVRNVTTTPAPIADGVHRRLAEDARRLSSHFLPRTGAYREIWLDGEPVAAGPADGEEEPLYGANYLPRKFKIGLATPDDNSIDVLTNDLGIIALFEGGQLTGYNLALGGGLGMTHNKPKTYPRLATPIVFVGADGLIAAADAVVRLQRDHGDRADRKHARLKYLVDDKGPAWIKAQLESYLGHALEPARPMPRFRIVDHLGIHDQGDGKCYLGIPVPSGRVADSAAAQLRAGLNAVIRHYAPSIVLTPWQDIILADLDRDAAVAVEAALHARGVRLAGDMTPVERWSLACPALPTCGLALTEAERVRQPLMEQIADALAEAGIPDELLSVRITGCPNGCARPYAGDIGIVGRMPGFYALYVGGDFAGTRMNSQLLDKVAMGEIAVTLAPLFRLFAAERIAEEGFGDFCHRVGLNRLRDEVAAARPAAVAV